MAAPVYLYQNTKLYKVPNSKMDGSMLYDFFGTEINALAICFSSAEKEMPAAEKELLGKILSAVKVDITKTPIINREFASDFSFKKMDEKFGVKHVLLFGTDFLNQFQNANVQKNKPFFLGEMEILLTESLSVLLHSADEKNALWKAMKGMNLS